MLLLLLYNVKYYPLKDLYTLHITVEVQHLKIMMKSVLILGTSTRIHHQVMLNANSELLKNNWWEPTS